jgi:hypothetical protein
MYMDMDLNLYEKCQRENVEKTRSKEAEREAAAGVWAGLLEQGRALGINS